MIPLRASRIPSHPRLTARLFLILLVLGVTGGALPALAAPWDNNPKLLLHVRAVTSQGACANYGLLGDCTAADVSGTLTTEGVGPWFFVYLLMAPGGLTEGVSAIQCGVDYQDGSSAAAGDGLGLDVLAWRLCATIQVITPGTPTWPAPGGGNRINWDLPELCQQQETGVVGYFYVGAYSDDLLRLTARPEDGLARVRTCPGEEISLDADNDLGSVVFSASGNENGCNPCLADCSAMPVESVTWSRLKRAGGAR